MTNDAEKTTSVEQLAQNPRPSTKSANGTDGEGSGHHEASPPEGLWQDTNMRIRATAHRAYAATPQPARDGFDKAIASTKPAFAQVRTYRVHITVGLGSVLGLIVIRRLVTGRRDH
jgi:hypothetical protein